MPILGIVPILRPFLKLAEPADTRRGETRAGSGQLHLKVAIEVLQRDALGKATVRGESGDSTDLPVGGPYAIRGATGVLVGDIWVLAGQSNMEGVGDLVDVEEPSPFVHSFQSREEWAIAEEPLHWLYESPQPVHHRLFDREPIPDRLEERDPSRAKGAGLGLPFAKHLHACTGVPIGLVPCAHGGTTMAHWDPRLNDGSGESLYGALLRRIHAVGGNIAGVLWYQGESDALPQQVDTYSERMTNLVSALRNDLAQSDLPFYVVQLGCVAFGAEQDVDGWNGIRELQRTWAGTVAGTAMVPTIDLGLDDVVHLATQELKRLGRRLAAVAAGDPPLAVARVTVDGPRIGIIVDNVRGGLRAQGRPAGFSLRDRGGKDLLGVFKVTLEENRACLHIDLNLLPPEAYLWYGCGLNPYCNITDLTDAALPAFGPWRVELRT